jgi:glycosyltransferase involved in cell wall biosynthesis
VRRQRAAAGDAHRLVVLTPIEPAPTGNGLAMRAELFRRSAPASLEVQSVIVPVAGRAAHGPAGAGAASVAPDAVRARAGALALATDRAWRDRLARVGSLPPAARAASPGLADAVVQAISGSGPVALHVVRAYMAPLGVAVAERLEAVWATLDLDEDDAGFARSAGDLESAAAYERLLDVFGPLFDGLSTASAGEAAAIGERHGLAVEHLPNAVPLAALSPRPARAGGDGVPSLLFVGNLTYPPNLEAADLLVRVIAPAVRRRLGRQVRVTLVGPHDGQLDRLRGADVEVTGFVPDLDPLYAAADAVVVPLLKGAGTRIKLLEAFAHGVPAVASPIAAAGLEVSDRHHLLLADDCDQAAAAIESLLTDAELAARLVGEAAALVRGRYCLDVVVPAIRDFFSRAAGRARHGVKPSRS